MARDHASASSKHVDQRITLRGLGFFDEIHDVTGQVPNGIERHLVPALACDERTRPTCRI
jgi:hypothetical protein